jgi:hypothetical protein
MRKTFLNVSGVLLPPPLKQNCAPSPSFLSGVRPSPLGTSATIWPTAPAPHDECGAVGGMRLGRGN